MTAKKRPRAAEIKARVKDGNVAVIITGVIAAFFSAWLLFWLGPDQTEGESRTTIVNQAPAVNSAGTAAPAEPKAVASAEGSQTAAPVVRSLATTPPAGRAGNKEGAIANPPPRGGSGAPSGGPTSISVNENYGVVANSIGNVIYNDRPEVPRQ